MMHLREKIKSYNVTKAFKIALAAVLSILTAQLLGLDYAVTAGIITVLSIQNTKRETLKTARNRGLAFLCALLIAYLCYHFMGFHVIAFVVYLFWFAFVCLNAKWGEAIAMDSVLISHFLAESNFGAALVLNEVLLFSIGVFWGILMNLHLRKSADAFARLSEVVDMEIKMILHKMSKQLQTTDLKREQIDCFSQLDIKIQAAKECALQNWNNTLWNQNTYELDYIKMRENQSRVLRNIGQSIVMIRALPAQAQQVADFFGAVEVQYHRENDVEELIEILENITKQMKQEKLPVDREEFEARAVLFYILKQVEEFLLLKNSFVKQYR